METQKHLVTRKTGPFDIDQVETAKRFFLELELGEGKQYLSDHLERLAATVVLAPPPKNERCGKVLEVGSYLHTLAAMAKLKGYSEVYGTYFGEKGKSEQKEVRSHEGELLVNVPVELFDAERDRFPYRDDSFDLVIIAEVLEHLNHDPMHMLIEAKRVLCEGGALLLTTPNCASAESLFRIMSGEHPYIFSVFRNPQLPYEPGARHVREYTSSEVREIIHCAGLEVETFLTLSDSDPAVSRWRQDLMRYCGASLDDRGEQIFCIARKQQTNIRVNRYPDFLYHAVR